MYPILVFIVNNLVYFAIVFIKKSQQSQQGLKKL